MSTIGNIRRKINRDAQMKARRNSEEKTPEFYLKMIQKEERNKARKAKKEKP